MKTKFIKLIKTKMKPYLNEIQISKLNEILKFILIDFEVIKKDKRLTFDEAKENQDLLINFLSAKQIEGCSERTINYYKSTIFKMLNYLNLKIENITTDDLRNYLSNYKNHTNASKTTIDNIEKLKRMQK